MILEVKKITSLTFPPSICPEVMGLDATVVLLLFLNVEFQASLFTVFFHPHQEAL